MDNVPQTETDYLIDYSIETGVIEISDRWIKDAQAKGERVEGVYISDYDLEDFITRLRAVVARAHEERDAREREAFDQLRMVEFDEVQR